jgi:hypothetical protein
MRSVNTGHIQSDSIGRTGGVGGAMLGDVFGVGNGYKRSLFTGIAKYRTTQRDTKDLLWNRLKN